MPARTATATATFLLIALTAALIVGTTGCGGGGGGTDGGKGTVSMQVHWPASTTEGVTPSFIPYDAVCVVLKASNDAGWTASAVAEKATSPATTSVTITDVPQGRVHLLLGAYDAMVSPSAVAINPAQSPSPNLLAWAQVDVNVSPGGTTKVPVSMSTEPDHINVVAAGGKTSLLVNQYLQFTGTAYDAADNVLLVPLTWSTDPTSVATVNTSGLVYGAGVGSADVKATAGTVTGTATVGVHGGVVALEIGIDPSTLQPWVATIGDSSLKGAYVSHVTPTATPTADTYILDTIQADSNGSTWTDNVHTQAYSGSTQNLTAILRVYDVSQLPTWWNYDVAINAGEYAGWGLGASDTKHGYVALATPLETRSLGQFARMDVHPEFNGTSWVASARINSPTEAKTNINIRVYDVSQMPLALDQTVTLSPGVPQSWTVGLASDPRGFVPILSPMQNIAASLTSFYRLVYTNGAWEYQWTVTTDTTIQVNVRAFAVDAASILAAAQAPRPAGMPLPGTEPPRMP
jgi:hypothetical protein